MILVPFPTSDSISNSSINRLTPGNPAPNPPDVENHPPLPDLYL